MRDRHNHQLPVASPFPAWVEGQEGPQPQGDSRGRRDLLPGIVQRFSESGAHSPQKGWQGREAGIVGRASPGSDREGPSRGDDGRSALKDLSEASITKVLKPVLAQDAILCTDGNKSYRAFANAENVTHVRLIASKKSRVIDKVFPFRMSTHMTAV